METPIRPPELGDKILVVMDNHPDSLEMLKTVVAHLPDFIHRRYTLLCCCPARYWEHSGSESPEVEHDIDEVWEAEDKELNEYSHYVEQAKQFLKEAGVPYYQIFHRTSMTDENLMSATIQEIKRSPYTGVIVNMYHEDLVNRLHGRGLTDMFRQIPKVVVWPVETKVLSHA